MQKRLGLNIVKCTLSTETLVIFFIIGSIILSACDNVTVVTALSDTIIDPLNPESKDIMTLSITITGNYKSN